jgi:sulfur-oxidizing protein SoxX
MLPGGSSRAQAVCRGAACLLAAATLHGASVQAEGPREPSVRGSVVADRIDTPLTTAAGDAARGKQLFTSREGGHCVLCHVAPGIDTGGNVGPSLDGVGKRLSQAQLRLRIVDITRVNPDAVMPAFHRFRDLRRVAKDHAGRTILSAQQVEDLVAYLAGLR